MKKVLVIDGCVHDLDFLRRHEVENPFHLLVASSFEEARELFVEHPDINVVTINGCVSGDFIMPAVFVEELRKEFQGPVVAIHHIDGFRHQLMEVGCTHEASSILWLLEEEFYELVNRS